MVNEGDLMWTPSLEFASKSRMADYVTWLHEQRGLVFEDYEPLRAWSAENIEEFWVTIWDYFEIQSRTPYKKVLDTRAMPGGKWFEGATVNYAEHVLRNERTAFDGKPAIYYTNEQTGISTLSWQELGRRVRRVATSLRALGLKSGDRAVAYMPNVPEAIIAFLACASIGVTWASSAPEFGVATVTDRFAQIEPRLLFVCDGYRFNGSEFARENEVQALVERLPTLEHVICCPIIRPDRQDAIVQKGRLWSDLLSGDDVDAADFHFEPMPFDYALWVLFSSGTTGLPKAIAQSHVGIVLEHYKLTALHMGLNQNSVMFFFTTTGWMMWNVLVSSLLTGGAIVLYDGSPAFPDNTRLWRLAEETGVTYFGASASFLQMMRRSGLVPKDQFKLKIDSVMTGGSPVGPELYEWFYENVERNCWFSSQSGGTETCSCLVTAVPLQPVYAGEIQARALGIDLHAWNDAGQDVANEVGELVLLKPFPSMPIYFCNDKDGRRYHESYFDVFPGVWRHGDFIKINDRGGCMIYGRSDSTLNRFGIRIGTAEVYHALEHIPEVADSMVICCELDEGRFFMPLFVVPKIGHTLDDALRAKINATLRETASPRHVPDKIYQIEAVPYTLTGKKMEVPVRKLLMGAQIEKVASRDAMANPTAMEFFIRFAREATDYERPLHR